MTNPSNVSIPSNSPSNEYSISVPFGSTYMCRVHKPIWANRYRYAEYPQTEYKKVYFDSVYATNGEHRLQFLLKPYTFDETQVNEHVAIHFSPDLIEFISDDERKRFLFELDNLSHKFFNEIQQSVYINAFYKVGSQDALKW